MKIEMDYFTNTAIIDASKKLKRLKKLTIIINSYNKESDNNGKENEN